MFKYILNGTVRRFFSSVKAKKVDTFDPAKDVTRDFLLYKNPNTAAMRYLFYFAGLNFIVWALPGYYTFVNFNEMLQMSEKRKKLVEQGVLARQWWESLVGWINEHKLVTQVVVQGLASAGFLLVGLFAARSVRQVVLLKGGQMVRMRTWTVIPSESRFVEYTVPVSNVSALTSRSDKKSPYVRLKIKGHPFYYLMDKRAGEFVSPQLYDKTIGYTRIFK